MWCTGKTPLYTKWKLINWKTVFRRSGELAQSRASHVPGLISTTTEARHGAHACNPSTWQVKAGGSRAQDHQWLCSGRPACATQHPASKKQTRKYPWLKLIIFKKNYIVTVMTFNSNSNNNKNFQVKHGVTFVILWEYQANQDYTARPCLKKQT